ncbi:MAG TPA: hypothetical protein VD767_05475 [Thermomicrobiales bacterium]|nr:hypothetical protein [Thermomicrobiales bacterium]
MPANDLNATRLNRRRFAGAGVFGAASLAFMPNLAAQEISLDGTPPAPPAIAPIPSPSETVAEIASRLDFDQDAIFAFVRDEIAWEPYVGVLRGPVGTLGARAGNSADQAILLAELLIAAQIQPRFASGSLDTASIDALLESLPATASDVADRYTTAVEATARHTLGIQDLEATPAPLDDEASAFTSRMEATSEAANELAVNATGISTQAILDAISLAGASLPPLPPVGLPGRESERHLWVQVADGPTWIDLDPSLPEGSQQPEVIETFAVLPDDWYHQVRVTIIADEWFGAPSPREVVSYTTTSAGAVDLPIALSMASADELAGLGTTLNELLAGQKTIYPTIYAGGGIVEPMAPILFGVSGQDAADVFGDAAAGAQDGETIAVWLVTDITSPDAATTTIVRPLLDRVPPDDRATGAIVAERIAPLELVPTEIGADTPQPFDTLTVIHVDVARIPPIDSIVKSTEDPLFGPFGALGPTLAGFRDTLGMDLEGAAGSWSFPSAPNVTAFHSSGGELPTLRVDLIHRERTSLPLDGHDAGVHPLVLSGVLDAIAEQMLLAPETRGDSPDDPSYSAGPSVGAIFAAAGEAGVPISLVQSQADLGATPIDPNNPLLVAALNQGLWIVTPAADVLIDDAPAVGWWLVDPNTGRTRDQLADGTAGVSMRLPRRQVFARGNLPGYSFLTRAIAWVVANSGKLACLGVGVAWGFLYAKATIKAIRGSTGAVIAGGVVSAGGMAGAMAFC